jgi:hypothetical protein
MEWLIVFLIFVAVTLALIHYKPADLPGFAPQMEGFSVAAVDPARVPACVERSTEAQSLLARFATVPATDDNAAELRLLISKLCCMEADIVAPSAGKYRTLPLQFRTSHDLEPASTTVGRCLSQSLPKRDVELALEKFQQRGEELLTRVLGGDCSDAKREFAAVLDRLRRAFNSCQVAQPSMDHPLGARDMGFWESRNVADLSAYQGISASP